MRRPLLSLAAAVIASASLLGLSVAPASASARVHISYSADLLGTMCGYTFTSGQIAEVFSTDGAVADPVTGEWLYIPAAHVTLIGVWATDTAGASYRVVGTETYSDLQGHLTSKIMFVGAGGVTDSINVVARSYSDGTLHFWFELGSCSFS